MAYTYDNFISAANAAGLRNAFSEQDLQIAQRNPEFGLSLLSLLKDNSNASTAEQQLLATEAANQLRKSYGAYNTGTMGTDSAYAGSYGTQINDLMDQINNYGSYNYGNQDSYQALLDSIVNQQPFSYDLQSDPSWGSYKKAYMREGDRASANALAQASAASGGRASSYALTAAQQAGNYYAGQLADIIPTLEQSAYSRYLSDFNNRLSSLGAIENDRAFDYQNWMNQYNMLQNSLGNYQGQDATDYQRYLDAYNQAYQAEQDRLAQEQLAYENALASYQALGYATPEVAAILGIKSGGSSGTSGSSGSGGGGGGGTGSGGGGGVTSTEEQLGELEAALAGNNEEEVDTSNFTVTNRNGNGWIAIGGGRMTWTELERAVNQGRIVEVIDPDKGTITYKYASSNNNSSNSNNNSTNNSNQGGGGTSRAPSLGGRVDNKFHVVALN